MNHDKAHSDLAVRFENVFQRLLTGESMDLYAKDASLTFEAIAANLLAQNPVRQGCYFDGVVGLTSVIKSPRKVEFNGDMWIGRDQSQWTEYFRATAIDKRSTKQGIWVIIEVGDDKAEAELYSAMRRDERP